MRHTKKELEFLVNRLNAETGSNFCLGYAYGGVRLEANSGSKDISQRLTTGQLYDQLATALNILDHIKRD